MTLSQLIQTEREKRGLSIAALAREVGYDPSHFSLLEKGLRRFDDEAVVKVAQALGLDPSVALLAGVRDRLPEAMRHHVPGVPLPSDPRTRYAGVRAHQAGHFDFEAKKLIMRVTSDWEGNVAIVRTLEECRPNADGRAVSEICFRERAVGSEDTEGSFELLRSPPEDTAVFEVQSEKAGPWLHHRIFFPDGWRRRVQQKDDAFSFRFSSRHAQGLSLTIPQFERRAKEQGVIVRDSSRGALNVFVRHFIKRLEVDLEFPEGYRPDLWQTFVRWGQDEFEASARDVGDEASRSMVFHPKGNAVRLTVNEPLVGYTFSIRWIPLDHQRYLEARHDHGRTS